LTHAVSVTLAVAAALRRCGALCEGNVAFRGRRDRCRRRGRRLGGGLGRRGNGSRRNGRGRHRWAERQTLRTPTLILGTKTPALRTMRVWVLATGRTFKMFPGSSDWPNLAVVAFVRSGVLAISSRFVAVWVLRRDRWQTSGRAYFTWSGGFDFTCHRRGRDHGEQDPCGESQHSREHPSVFTLVRASRQGDTGVGCPLPPRDLEGGLCEAPIFWPLTRTPQTKKDPTMLRSSGGTSEAVVNYDGLFIKRAGCGTEGSRSHTVACC
jgi:hypothetical protein